MKSTYIGIVDIYSNEKHVYDNTKRPTPALNDTIRSLRKFAEDDGNDEKHENSNNGNGDHPIGSHPKTYALVSYYATAQGADSIYLRAMPRRVLTLRST